jgi:hypothetical protein
LGTSVSAPDYRRNDPGYSIYAPDAIVTWNQEIAPAIEQHCVRLVQGGVHRRTPIRQVIRLPGASISPARNCGNDMSGRVYTPDSIVIGVGNEQISRSIDRQPNWPVQDAAGCRPSIPDWASETVVATSCNDGQHTSEMINSDDKTLAL